MNQNKPPRSVVLTGNSATSLALAGILSFLLASDVLAQMLTPFGTVTLAPAFQLNGVGSNVDSLAFWEAPNPADTLLFVTAKSNDLVEVWKYPFANNELPPIQFGANVNGVVVDQDWDLLYVSDRVVSVFSLPGLEAVGEFGRGVIGVGENNLDLLKVPGGETVVYVSDDHNVHRFEGTTWNYLGAFAPPVSSIESVLADDFYQMILVPEEQGPAGNVGIYTYHPDGTPFERNGSNRFGDAGEFDSDEEGIALYTFPAHGTADDGTGFIVVADQKSTETDFEFFHRQSAAHLGTVRLTNVTNTDGIASTQRPLPQFPMGMFAAINNDTSTAVVGWDALFAAIGWDLAPEAMSITPATTGPTIANQIEFTVVFSEAVTMFDDAADLLITHQGTAHSETTISGSGTTYTISVSGISGAGSFTLAISPTSDLEDSSSQRLAAGVTSPPVLIETAYQRWAAERGLVSGINDSQTDDPDGDGSPNLQEFALDGNPLSAANSLKTRAEIAELAGTRYLSLTFPAREGAVFGGGPRLSAVADGIFYALAASRDLTAFDDPLVEIVPALNLTLPPANDGWRYRTFRLSHSVAESDSGFIRLSTGASPP